MCSKDQIDNLCILLKLLFEEYKNFKKLSIVKYTYQFNIPYSSLLSKVLQDKGIMEKKGGNTKVEWRWISTTEPSRHMAEAILKACADESRVMHRLIPSRNKTITEHTNPIDTEFNNRTCLELIQLHVNRMKTQLISIGFTKEKALEIIKSQIV